MIKTIRDNVQIVISDLLKENTIIVLKGIEDQHLPKINLQDLFNKSNTKSWLDLYESKRRIIYYEEFLFLYNFIISEFDHIYIVNNNIFNNFYPLNVDLALETKMQLADFFDHETDDTVSDIQVYDGEKYTKIYSNLKKINNTYWVRYNDESEIYNSAIKTINIFDTDNKNTLEIIDENQEYSKNKILYLQEPDDYLNLLDILFNQNQNFVYTNIDSYTGNKETLIEKLSLLQKYNKNLKILKITKIKQKLEYNPEFKNILKQYWGHDSFRSLKVYDIDNIQNGTKTVKEISQEDIINDIAFQVESVVNKAEFDYSDVFVTAPTGAGKSAMFLIPAIYLAEKYNLVTLVISPLIGLMNDQVSNLEKLSYKHAKTINSDISQIEKEEIMQDIKDGKCHILYLSPEALLARSDISQIIGDRQIGLIVIDEAHIVTTWGKQFRPDYWYLGDYIKKLRKKQSLNSHPFIIATFTATAIYHGVEDMYSETLDSLNMRKTITYLGYVKRDDIDIKISEIETRRQRGQYQLEKFEDLLKTVDRAIIMNKKTLIYFPNIPLIESFYNYCKTLEKSNYIAKYYGPMNSEDKKESAELFKTGEKRVMLATKAFGMGIDIKDISIVCHFAPTGNVCDYVQEIGRAARDPNIKGEAIYSHMRNDFQHINRLHGLSTVKKYQLIKVIQKVNELFNIKLNSENLIHSRLSKKRNEMLVDAENFTYIFEGPRESSQEELIAKVKTALLLIQKDYTSKMGFSPFAMRPSTLFAQGFFEISGDFIDGLIKRYGLSCFRECPNAENIYTVNLQKIWEKDFSKNLSFPKFKFLLYSADKELDKFNLNKMIPATCIQLEFTENENCAHIQNAIDFILRNSADTGSYLKVEFDKNEKDKFKNIANYISKRTAISSFRATSIANILIATIKNYVRNYNRTMNAEIMKTRITQDGLESYTFNRPIENFINWICSMKKFIHTNEKDGILYVVKNKGEKDIKEIITALGYLEAINYLKFKASGGLNSQIYIYVNQTKTMEEVIRKPQYYNNKLLEKVAQRHKISVAMLTFLYQNNFDSATIWNYIENYFLGNIPEQVQRAQDSITVKI